MNKTIILYITGNFSSSTVNFDPGLGTNNLNITAGTGSNNFILKLQNDGNFAWVRKFEGNSNGQSVIVDNSNNIICTGYYGDSVDFDINAGLLNKTSLGESDYYVHKMDQLNLSSDSFNFKTFTIAPNPTNNFINITTQNPINAIKIIDIAGRNTNITKFDNNKIDVSNLQNGVYFLEINTDTGSFKEKFIKKLDR